MRGRVLIFIVITLVICGLYYLLVFGPQSDRITQATADADASEKKAQDLRNELKRRQGLQAMAPKLREQAKTLDDAMPNDPQLAQFILQVQDSANSSGVEWVSISPTPPAAGTGFSLVAMTMNVEGGYFQVQDFLVRLENLSRAVRIEGLALSPASATTASGTSTTSRGGSPRLGASLTMKMFVAAPSPVPGAPVPAPTGGAT